MLKSPSNAAHKQQGFSLVEIMVGMIIGMLGIIIIMQVTSVFEARKRTTSSGDDAQNGGAISLSSLQRDLAQAGYGFSSRLLVGSSLVTPFVTLNPLMPVTLNPATLAAIGDTGSDKLMLMYGNSNNVEGSWITNSTATLPYQVALGAGTGGITDGGKGFNVGDWVIPNQSGVTNPNNLYQVVANAASNVVAVTGAPPSLVYVPTNPAVPILFNLGLTPSLLVYGVINRSLSVCDYFRNDCTNTANWSQLAGDVYALRAVCASATSVRIALVTRNAQYDPAVVTTANPTWNGNVAIVTTPATAWGANWNHYRYKIFESVVPVRNAIWSGVQGCA